MITVTSIASSSSDVFTGLIIVATTAVLLALIRNSSTQPNKKEFDLIPDSILQHESLNSKNFINMLIRASIYSTYYWFRKDKVYSYLHGIIESHVNNFSTMMEMNDSLIGGLLDGIANIQDIKLYGHCFLVFARRTFGPDAFRLIHYIFFEVMKTNDVDNYKVPDFQNSQHYVILRSLVLRYYADVSDNQLNQIIEFMLWFFKNNGFFNKIFNSI